MTKHIKWDFHESATDDIHAEHLQGVVAPDGKRYSAVEPSGEGRCSVCCFRRGTECDASGSGDTLPCEQSSPVFIDDNVYALANDIYWRKLDA